MKTNLIKLADALDKLGFEKETDEIDSLIKESGSIPAGMHRSLLQRGLFGRSEYDSLNYSDDSEDEDEESTETQAPLIS